MEQMTAVAIINGQQIQVSNDEAQFVPIKPICDALGIDRKRQQDKIKEHPILSSVGGLKPLTGSDGKTYEMYCLPLEFVFGWLFTINPNNVNELSRPSVISFQEACYRALYSHFTKGMKKERELLKAENDLLKQKDELSTALAQAKDETARLKRLIGETDAKLVAIRDERHNPQPGLFD